MSSFFLKFQVPVIEMFDPSPTLLRHLPPFIKIVNNALQHVSRNFLMSHLNFSYVSQLLKDYFRKPILEVTPEDVV